LRRDLGKFLASLRGHVRIIFGVKHQHFNPAVPAGARTGRGGAQAAGTRAWAEPNPREDKDA